MKNQEGKIERHANPFLGLKAAIQRLFSIQIGRRMSGNWNRKECKMENERQM
jgi:hypothetical protein